MSNVTQPKDNFTLAYRTSILFGTLSVTPLLIFLYINGVILFILRNKPVFRETPRYVLLYNLLFADTFQLVVGQFLYILATVRVYMIRYLCVITVILAMLTTEISPYNLAMMSLERYVAVCFPLRHSAIVTIKNTGVSIAVVWAICGINTIIRIFMLILLESLPLDQYMLDFCAKETLFEQKLFYDFDKAFTGVTFVLVGIVILCSYFGVMIAARSASSDKASTSKAKKTVVLHMIQLLLILSSTLVSPILTAFYGKVDRITLITIYYILFLCLVNLPRCLSGLIYGLRDQTIRPFLLYHLSFGLRRPKLGQTSTVPSNKR
ncbi:odorant receptor 131-2-like [Hypomesus transpacificus]|uniref:odorant receptor 131-2-like n=1 Tax=Hypomesus transpacificus TaxID=137520 RepID=UPI001F08691A|nr:odorant receptor 131-2-like [Hypomesus transpacificus]